MKTLVYIFSISLIQLLYSPVSVDLQFNDEKNIIYGHGPFRYSIKGLTILFEENIDSNFIPTNITICTENKSFSDTVSIQLNDSIDFGIVVQMRIKKKLFSDPWFKYQATTFHRVNKGKWVYHGWGGSGSKMNSYKGGSYIHPILGSESAYPIEIGGFPKFKILQYLEIEYNDTK